MRKPIGTLAQLLLERLDQLDQRERVGVEVVDERLPLADRGRVDLQDVGEVRAHDLEHAVAIEGALFDMGFCGHLVLPDIAPSWSAATTLAPDGRSACAQVAAVDAPQRRLPGRRAATATSTSSDHGGVPWTRVCTTS